MRKWVDNRILTFLDPHLEDHEDLTKLRVKLQLCILDKTKVIQIITEFIKLDNIYTNFNQFWISQKFEDYL